MCDIFTFTLTYLYNKKNYVCSVESNSAHYSFVCWVTFTIHKIVCMFSGFLHWSLFALLLTRNSWYTLSTHCSAAQYISWERETRDQYHYNIMGLCFAFTMMVQIIKYNTYVLQWNVYWCDFLVAKSFMCMKPTMPTVHIYNVAYYMPTFSMSLSSHMDTSKMNTVTNLILNSNGTFSFQFVRIKNCDKKLNTNGYFEIIRRK